MMRHWINFGLLFSFPALAVTGVMAYLYPFSLVTARIHIVFGGLTVALVILHLVSRTKYFSSKLTGKHSSRGMVMTVLFAILVLLGLALRNAWPVNQVMAGSYEARHRTEIVRGSPMAGWLDGKDGQRFVSRSPNPDADTAISLMIRFREGMAKPPAIAVWAETRSGTMIETLYLDEALAYAEDVDWQGVKTKRHHLLPVWRHKHTVVSGVNPDGRVDAFTSSTPEHSFSLDDSLKIGEEGFVICVEVNAVRDPNKAFPDADLGQPSVLYTAYVEPQRKPGYALLELTAHGGDAVEHGTPTYDFEGLDSALDLMDLLLVKTAPIAK